MIKRLSELNIGEHATIKIVHGRGRMRTRMFDMGITPGARIYYRKNAPMGDPIQISIRGYELTLRKCEAYHILIDTKDDNDLTTEEQKKDQLKQILASDKFSKCNECADKNLKMKRNKKNKLRGRFL